MIRFLLIEDDPEEAQALEHALITSSAIAIDRAANAADARTHLETNDYDVIVLDLALPPDARRLAANRKEGERLVGEVLASHRGTVLYVLSGHADLHLASQFSNLAGSEDMFGSREAERMLRFFPKEELANCVDSINEHLASLDDLQTVRIESSEDCPNLDLSEERAVQIITRRTGGSVARLEPLAGGLSGAKTLRLMAETGLSSPQCR